MNLRSTMITQINYDFNEPDDDEMLSNQKRERTPPKWTENYQMSANSRLKSSEKQNVAVKKNEIAAHFKNETWILEHENNCNCN